MLLAPAPATSAPHPGAPHASQSPPAPLALAPVLAHPPHQQRDPAAGPAARQIPRRHRIGEGVRSSRVLSNSIVVHTVRPLNRATPLQAPIPPAAALRSAKPALPFSQLKAPVHPRPTKRCV
jgi:hypothetical protein